MCVFVVRHDGPLSIRLTFCHRGRARTKAFARQYRESSRRTRGRGWGRGPAPGDELPPQSSDHRQELPFDVGVGARACVCRSSMCGRRQTGPPAIASERRAQPSRSQRVNSGRSRIAAAERATTSRAGNARQRLLPRRSRRSTPARISAKASKPREQPPTATVSAWPSGPFAQRRNGAYRPTLPPHAEPSSTEVRHPSAE